MSQGRTIWMKLDHAMRYPMRLITFVAALAIVCAPADAQSQPGSQEQRSSQELAQAIQAGSISAMMVAGESGDQQYIPTLLMINKDKKRNQNERVAAQLALAKLGNNEQLREIYCELKTGTYFQQLDVIGKKLPYIRGWFTIWLTTELMEGRIAEGRIDKKAAARLPDDAALPDLASTSRYWINEWQNVPRMLDLPSAIEWRKYVEENREVLSKLQPRAADLINDLPDCKGRHNSQQ